MVLPAALRTSISFADMCLSVSQSGWQVTRPIVSRERGEKRVRQAHRPMDAVAGIGPTPKPCETLRSCYLI